MGLRQQLTDWGLWSQVVAGLIVAAILGVLALASTFAVTELPTFRAWLLNAIPVSRLQIALWSLLGLTVGIIFGVWVSFRGAAHRASAAAPETTDTTMLDGVQSANPSSPHSVLQPADWNVLYVISQRPDPERVTRFEILAVTGLNRLRADIACDRLQAHHLIVFSGTDRASRDQLYGILPAGRQEALRLHRERAHGAPVPPDDPAEMAPAGQRVVLCLRLNHAPGYWMTVDELAAWTRLTKPEVEAALFRMQSAEVIDRSDAGVRLGSLGEIMYNNPTEISIS